MATAKVYLQSGTRVPPSRLLSGQRRNLIMAIDRNPNDPYRSPDDPYLSNSARDDLRRQTRLENELQADPELAEGPISGGKIAAFAIAIALVLGAVFYGLNNTSMSPGTSSTAQNKSSSPPAAPPGTTTGAAPSRPQPSPSPAPANPPPANPAPSK
jgi:hypothetical protein